MPRRLIFALCAALLSTAACAGNDPGADGGLSEARGVALVVRNENFADVTVYAVRDGTRARVGWVPGNSTGRFTVSGALIPTGELNLVAFPLASTGAAASGRVLVREGQTVQFTISPQLAGSYATVQ